MKRIGKTDAGGVLVEITNSDVVRLMDACQALDQLFGVIEVSVPNAIQPGANTIHVDHVEVTPATRTSYPKMTVTGHVNKPAKDNKSAPKTARKTSTRAKREPLPARICLNPKCKKSFIPIRHDQTCCNKKCRSKLPRTTYPKYDAAAAKAKRLAALKELDKGKRGTFTPHDDGFPVELKQAQREAAQE